MLFPVLLREGCDAPGRIKRNAHMLYKRPCVRATWIQIGHGESDVIGRRGFQRQAAFRECCTISSSPHTSWEIFNGLGLCCWGRTAFADSPVVSSLVINACELHRPVTYFRQPVYIFFSIKKKTASFDIMNVGNEAW